MRIFPNARTRRRCVQIGIDEHNNGGSPEGFPHVGVSYVQFPGTELLEPIKKGKGFSKDEHVRETYRQNALRFLSQNPNFRYFTFTRTKDKTLDHHTLCVAIARLIYETAMPLIDFNPVVIIDGAPFRSTSEATIKYILKEYGLSDLNSIFFKHRGDTQYSCVTYADRVAYCIGALRFGRPTRKWPFLGKKINFKKSPEGEIDSIDDLLQ